MEIKEQSINLKVENSQLFFFGIEGSSRSKLDARIVVVSIY